MTELAKLIRKGLEVVPEDVYSWGVDNARGEPTANIIGLALVGKIGLPAALELTLASIREGHEEGPASKEIRQQIGINTDQAVFLAMRHFQMPAADIATAMENESFEWEPA